MSNMEIKLKLKECVDEKGETYFICNVDEKENPIRLFDHVLIIRLNDEEGRGGTLAIRRYDDKARRHKFRNENDDTSPGRERNNNDR